MTCEEAKSQVRGMNGSVLMHENRAKQRVVGLETMGSWSDSDFNKLVDLVKEMECFFFSSSWVVL
jgi:hypothetical protein